MMQQSGELLLLIPAGCFPHTGESPMQVIYQHLSTDVPAPSTLVPRGTCIAAPGLPAVIAELRSRGEKV